MQQTAIAVNSANGVPLPDERLKAPRYSEGEEGEESEAPKEEALCILRLMNEQL